MKLNYKRTIFVGFAFFLICAFWQAYDAIVPLMLVNKFGLNQFWSGFIMALDNVLALFLLPLFGALSDKKSTKWGKRTPFVVIGTVLAIVCFVGLTFADNAQLNALEDRTGGTNQVYWNENYEITNYEYEKLTHATVSEKYTMQDYAARILFNKDFNDLTATEKADAQAWFLSLNSDSVYFFNKTNDSYRFIAPPASDATQAVQDAYNTAVEQAKADGYKQFNTFMNVINPARSLLAAEVTAGQWWVLLIFIVVLLMVLISMAIFRSPAVAIMPDVTVKPLRSKGNAIINLMGTTGGILVLVLGMLFGTGKAVNQIMSYSWYVVAVCGVMLAALAAFIFLVKEKKWNNEMLEAQAVLDSEEAEKEKETAKEQNTEIVPKSEKLSKAQFSSLILILSSVALWFIGYNAITSKYSLYAVNVLDTDFNMTLLIAQGAAILSYVPVGMVATKVGRKRTILFGIAMLTLSFTGAIFVTAATPPFIMWILFSLAGIAWASINVNSFPMVVELSQGGSIGKYTGYYYTASMAAQIVTPLLSGLLMDMFGSMKVLFPYGAVFVALSFVTMFFVKYGDSKKGK